MPGPLQNRVCPDGELIATTARGSMMGNRGGRIHDAATRSLTSRRWASAAWICCTLEFKERHRNVWRDGYTELFFLDEVTAIAAGHRPCFECRRRDAVAFAEAVARYGGLDSRPRAPELDRRLHAERLDGRAKRLCTLPLSALPDGAMIRYDGAFFAVRGAGLLRWSPTGYAELTQRPSADLVETLTPPTSLAALTAGFQPCWHGSA